MRFIKRALLTLLMLGAAAAEAEGVRVVGASSSLAGKTRVMEWSKGKPVWRAANFQPASAMDGSEETAWCEGAPGPGIGEWLEFQVDQPIREVSLLGGFRKVSIPPEDVAGNYEHDQIDGWFDQILRTYQSNGRPAVLELTTDKGQVIDRLQLGDRTLGEYDFAVSLAPGRYRLRITQVYPGTRFEDTCIAEVDFRRSVTQWIDPIPSHEAHAQVSPQRLPEALRPFTGHERCLTTAPVKVLPQEVRLLGMTVLGGATPDHAELSVAVRSPSGVLQPSTFFSCQWGVGGLFCSAEGDDTEKEALDAFCNDFPAWSLGLKTSAKAQVPREWTGDYEAFSAPVHLKDQFQVAVHADAKRDGSLVVTATRGDTIAETARYTCALAP